MERVLNPGSMMSSPIRIIRVMRGFRQERKRDGEIDRKRDVYTD